MIYLSVATKDFYEKMNLAWESDQTVFVLPSPCPVSEEWLKKSEENIPENLKKDHFGILTSGSTGSPKLVVGNKKRTENLVDVIHERQNLDEIMSTVMLLPASYSYAFVNQWLWSKKFNRVCKITDGFAAADLLENELNENESIMLCMVGSQVSFFRRYFGESGKTFPKVQHLNFAGGKFPQGDLDIVKSIFPNAVIYNNYGCTEAMPRLTIRKEEDSDNWQNIGFPLKGIEMKQQSNSELVFKSPYSAAGHYENSGFVLYNPEEWISTGDIGTEQHDGSWEIGGRKNEVFKRYGEKISLTILLNHVKSLGVRDAHFYTEIGNDGETGHTLVLSPHPEDKSEVKKILVSFRKYYSRAYWPVRVESVEEFPQLGNGKIDTISLSNSNNKTIHWEQKGI